MAASITPRHQLALLLSISGFLLVSSVSFVNTFARTGGIFNVIPIFAEDQIGLNPGQIGLGISLVTITGVILVYPSGMLIDRFGRKGIITLSTAFAGTGMIFFTMATSFSSFLLAATLWGIGSGIAGAAPAAYAADLAPPGMIAPAMSMFRTIADFGYVVGPLSLGLISDLSGSQTALLFTAALLFFSGITFFFRAPETLPQTVASTSRPSPS